MLNEYLKNNKIFKLVCGAGNECAEDVERYVTLYSKANAQMFDICAKPEILEAAKRGLEKSGTTENRFICVSVGIKGDPHISKSEIIDSKCTKCAICQNICPNNAINNYEIITDRCIGCGQCYRNCKSNAIEITEKDVDLNTVLPELIKMGIDCIELHATSEDSTDIWGKWDIINTHFKGMVSICIDRLNLGNKQVINRIKRMLSTRKPYTTIIQADGIPMSGSDDTYKTTLQAVAMAEIIQDEKLPVYILLSGGTNSKTRELANLCGINYNGIAIGSYARKIVKPYITNPDFYDTKVFNKALDIAKKLVDVSIK